MTTVKKNVGNKKDAWPSGVATTRIAADSKTHPLMNDPQVLFVMRAIQIYGEPVSVARLSRLLNDSESRVGTLVGQLETHGLLVSNDHSISAADGAMGQLLARKLPLSLRRSISKAWCSVLNKERHIPKMKVIELLLIAGLWDEAVDLLKNAIRQSEAKPRYHASLLLYDKLALCRQRLGQSPVIPEQVSHALVLNKIGRQRSAKCLLASLLLISRQRRDVLSEVAVELGMIRLERNDQERRITSILKNYDYLRLHGVASEILDAFLVASYVSSGQYADARGGLAKEYNVSRPRQEPDNSYGLTAASGYLLLNLGHFKDALRTFQALSPPEPAKAAVQANIAICLEHLGKLRDAYAVLSHAHRLAARMEHQWGQVCCLTNLGNLKIKFGALEDANRYYARAEAIARKYDESSHTLLSAIAGEKAVLQGMRGEYQAAMAGLRRALRCRTIFHSERLQWQLRLCEMLIDIGRPKRAMWLLKELATTVCRSSRLYNIRWALLASRVQKDSQAALTILEEAILMAHESRLLYEECRLKLEYGRRALFSHCSDVERDNQIAYALSVADREGYRLLQVEGLLLRELRLRRLCKLDKQFYARLCWLGRAG